MAVKALGEDAPAFDPWVMTSTADPEIVKTISKRGRVLSAANENKLRKARDLLSEVIVQVEDQTEDEKASQKPLERKSAENKDDLPESHDTGDDEPPTDETTDASPADDIEPEADLDAEIVELVEQFLEQVEQTLTED